MPIRSGWKLQREGITLDTLIRFLFNTALNPSLTLPLLLLARHSAKVASLLETPYGSRIDRLKLLKTLVYLGLAKVLSSTLDDQVLNNFKLDKYQWDANGEVVVVTGGSDGIGGRVVRLLAEKGVRVAVVDVQPLRYEAPPSVHYYNCDIANPSSVTETCAAIRQRLGNPTVLINNAGVARGNTILGTTRKDLRLTFGVNTFSHYYMAQELLPNMVEKNHGLVLTMASLASYVTAPRMTDYGASKAAALAFHEGLSSELATVYNAPKVRTVVVCPGYTKTALFTGFDEGDGFLSYTLDPDTVAETVAKAVLRGRSDHIMIPLNNRWISCRVRAWPSWMQEVLRRRLSKLMTGWSGRQVEQPGEKDVS